MGSSELVAAIAAIAPAAAVPAMIFPGRVARKSLPSFVACSLRSLPTLVLRNASPTFFVPSLYFSASDGGLRCTDTGYARATAGCGTLAPPPTTAEAMRSASSSNVSPGWLMASFACMPIDTRLKSCPKRGSITARVSGASGCPDERSTSCTIGGDVTGSV